LKRDNLVTWRQESENCVNRNWIRRDGAVDFQVGPRADRSTIRFGHYSKARCDAVEIVDGGILEVCARLRSESYFDYVIIKIY
jgi:hypothetical protein